MAILLFDFILDCLATLSTFLLQKQQENCPEVKHCQS